MRIRYIGMKSFLSQWITYILKFEIGGRDPPHSKEGANVLVGIIERDRGMADHGVRTKV